MNLDKYELNSGKNNTTYEFFSVGIKGHIRKIIQYAPANYHDLYNLGFGDYIEEIDQIDDEIVTNNGDAEKVLRTVIESLFIFTSSYPKAIVYATGSTKSRTRYYQKGINNYLEDVEKYFEIYGEKNKEWCKFEKGINYDAFLIKRKI